jgi:hypothetical protein
MRKNAIKESLKEKEKPADTDKLMMLFRKAADDDDQDDDSDLLAQGCVFPNTAAGFSKM